MRKAAALCAIACLATANPAFAIFSPTGHSVLATGEMTLSSPGLATLSCTATFNGIVSGDGTMWIYTATFSGGLLNACAQFKATVPFTIIGGVSSSVAVQSFTITGPVQCGPGALTGTWTNGSPSHFDILNQYLNPGSCLMALHLTVQGITNS